MAYTQDQIGRIIAGGADLEDDNIIPFESPVGSISGSNSNVLTGSLQIDPTNEQIGRSALCFYQGSVPPTFTGGIIVGTVGVFAINQPNLIGLINISAGNYIVSYGGQISNLLRLMPPVAVTDLSLTDSGNGSVILNWTNPSETTGVRITRNSSVDGSEVTMLSKATNAGSDSYTDNATHVGVVVTYKVYPSNGYGENVTGSNAPTITPTSDTILYDTDRAGEDFTDFTTSTPSLVTLTYNAGNFQVAKVSGGAPPSIVLNNGNFGVNAVPFDTTKTYYYEFTATSNTNAKYIGGVTLLAVYPGTATVTETVIAVGIFNIIVRNSVSQSATLSFGTYGSPFAGEIIEFSRIRVIQKA